MKELSYLLLTALFAYPLALMGAWSARKYRMSEYVIAGWSLIWGIVCIQPLLAGWMRAGPMRWGKMGDGLAYQLTFFGVLAIASFFLLIYRTRKGVFLAGMMWALIAALSMMYMGGLGVFASTYAPIGLLVLAYPALTAYFLYRTYGMDELNGKDGKKKSA